MEIQIPMKVEALSLVPTIEHYLDLYGREIESLNQSKWGVYDDDELVRDRARLGALQEFVNVLDSLKRQAETPVFRTSSSVV